MSKPTVPINRTLLTVLKRSSGDIVNLVIGKVVQYVLRGLLCLIAFGGAATFTEAQKNDFRLNIDLDVSGRTYVVEIDRQRGSTLRILRGRKILWKGVPKAWRPWKLSAADVDGDGRPEIIVGITKSTKFFSKPHNCLFIYGWDGKQAFPKWLGSSLSRPFTDFLFADIYGQRGTELIAVETMLDGKKVIAAYRWSGFGFTLDRQSEPWESARLLGVDAGKIEVEADGEKIVLGLALTRSMQ